MADITPVTREEFYLAKAGGQDVPVPSAVTREEYYLEKLTNDSVVVPSPVTCREKFLYFACGGEIDLPSEDKMTRLERLIAKAGGMDVATPTAVTWLEKFWANVEGGGWKIAELTGALPMTFRSNGTALVDYRIYGTVDGAGVQTEQHGYKIPLTVSGTETKTTDVYIGDSKLGEAEYVDYEEQKVYKRTENLAPFIDEWGNGYVSKSGDISSASEDVQERYSPHIAVEPNETYQWSYQTGSFPKSSIKNAWTGIGWYSDDGFISRAAGEVNITLEIVAPANAKYAILSFRSFGENYNTVFIKSATPPETYIPYLQPTDPPLPLPAIETFKGENTFDSTETLGQVTITGKIKEA